MDKPKEPKTITIKINGKENSFVEKDKDLLEKQKIDSKQQKTTPSKPINPTNSETAAAKEQTDESDSFEWVLPKTTTTPIKEDIKTTPDSTKKKKIPNLTTNHPFKVKKLPFKKINLSTFFSIFFAVLLGTFFGLMLLKIVPAEKVVEDDLPVVNEGMEAPPTDEKSTSNGTLTAARPAIAAAVVQEGIYSTQESAAQIKKGLNDKGIPAEVFTSDGQFALFVGVSNQVEGAKSIGTELKASGVDTYAKQWSVGEKNLSNLHDEEKKLLEASPQIFQSILASVASTNGTDKVPQGLMDEVNQQHASLKKISKEKLQNKNIIQLHSQLEAAVAQLKIYDQKPQTSTLNTVQQHLLTFLANYQSL
ncbi:hypothetical protein R4Z10_16585 [Niallia sp. XMNu-256]|uniref:hypothetical protein n=1 Tax=Niallia sp. XMNu-256 TaxID=3082444 RepID=UPI0030D1EF08